MRGRMVTSREGVHIVQRIEPSMPVQGMQSFEIASPVETHHKVISCKEAGCQRYRDGWRTVLDVSTLEGARQARWIINYSGRKYKLEEVGNVLTFTFPAFQRCFGKHTKPLERPELYIVRDGDWRGNPTGKTMQHTRPEHWVEHSAETLDKLRTAQQKG